jgi:predicted nucleic acid-binding Zn ribbon protein
MKTLVCPHCQTHVPDRTRVCTGCGAEIVRGANRHERALVGVVFTGAAILISIILLLTFEIARGSTALPSPNSDGAFLVFFGLIVLLVIAYMAGKGVARVLRKS